MSDRDPFWDALKQYKQGKFDADRARFLADAKATDDGAWTKHTEYHWSRTVNGQRLDYWPSRKKFQFAGKVHFAVQGVMWLRGKGDMDEPES